MGVYTPVYSEKIILKVPTELRPPSFHAKEKSEKLFLVSDRTLLYPEQEDCTG